MADYWTPLRRARGLGSAKTGVGAFITKRLTGVALVPLLLWFAWAAVGLSRSGYDGAVAWLASPINATLLILLALITCEHMRIGMRVVVEDYIHKGSTKAILLILNTLFCWLLAAIITVCVLNVAFVGAVLKIGSIGEGA